MRIEAVAGQDVLIAPNGQAVTGVSPLGLETATRMLFLPRGVPGVGEVRVSPTPVTPLVRCREAPDGTPRCPALPVDSTPHRESLPQPDAWSPAPATREDVAHALSLDGLVSAIDSVASAIGVTPGGYFANRPRLECWNLVPTRRQAQ